MNNFNQRKYYKIFSGSNQTGGYDKIHLGYESETAEIILKKDKTTSFHVPFFSSIKDLIPEQIIGDGAVPGPIPAMADRIFQKQSGYGQTTPWGSTTGPADGKWLCSWLYSLSGETPQWLDRYYNPGRITYDEAFKGEITLEGYKKNDPVFIDTPSSMKIEPGVYYQYFHNGEKTAQEIVNTFAGNDSSHLRLDLDTWTSIPPDKSIYNNQVFINNFKDAWSIDLKEPDVIDRNALNFKNNNFIDARVTYSDNYNLSNEFTINFWIQEDNWDNATSTQLVGNFNYGGYGIFYNNLKNYPFFVIPETFYGHLFFFNQEGNNYLDKSTQPVITDIDTPLLSGSSSPIKVAINGEEELVVIDTGVLNSVYKVNHLGDILAIPRASNGTPLVIIGDLKDLFIDKNNGCYVITTTSTYYFDKNLTLVSLSADKPYIDNKKFAYNVDGILQEEICLDFKCDNLNNKWVINLQGDLFFNNQQITNITGCTSLAIDPVNNIWVLYDKNKIVKYNAETLLPTAIYEVGLNANNGVRNLSFVSSYDRNTNTQTWYALAYYSDDQILYQLTLNGEIKQLTFIPDKVNIEQSPPAQQDKGLLKFSATGDFTGYEWKRIFNNVLYSNTPQIQFKIAAQTSIKNTPLTTFTVSVPVQYFSDNTWHLVTCTYENQTMKVYIDTRLRDQLTLPGTYNLSYVRKNDLYIGTPSGKFTNLNIELNSKALIFNGYIDNIKIYDYALKPENLQMFLRSRFIGQDLTWNLPTAPLQYVEGIDRFFKHKLPGSKSTFFKLKLSGLQIKDSGTRKTVEVFIKNAIQQTKPAYTELLYIEWVE